MRRISPLHLSTFYLLLIAVVAVGCGPSTSISGTWISPEASKKTYRNIAVVALSTNSLAKQQVERDLQAALQQAGIQSSTSMDLFPPEFLSKQQDKEEILNKVREKGNDAILTVSLLDEKTETRYVPGNMPYAPYGFNYYGNFGGYYLFRYPLMYAPGYYTHDKIYFIETNLYDAATENLMWSAQSETYNPSDLQSFSKGFAKVTVDRIVQEGVLKK